MSFFKAFTGRDGSSKVNVTSDSRGSHTTVTRADGSGSFVTNNKADNPKADRYTSVGYTSKDGDRSKTSRTYNKDGSVERQSTAGKKGIFDW